MGPTARKYRNAKASGLISACAKGKSLLRQHPFKTSCPFVVLDSAMAMSDHLTDEKSKLTLSEYWRLQSR